MEEKLIKLLLQNYKNEGIDLYALVDEPLFIQLPLDKKIKLIKQFASHISSGTSRTLTKNDIKPIISDILLSGVAGAGLGLSSALTAAAHYKGGFLNTGKIPWGSIAVASGVSGGLFAAGTALQALKIHNQRKLIGNKLDEVVNSPTDENAIQVLLERSKQVNPNHYLSAPSAASSMVRDIAHGLPLKVLTNIAPAHIHSRTFDINANTPVSPDFTKQEVDEIARKAKLSAFNINNFTKK